VPHLVHAQLLRHTFNRLGQVWTVALGLDLSQRRHVRANTEHDGLGARQSRQRLVFDAEEALVEMRVELLLVDGVLLVGVVVVAVDAEEVDAVDLETPLRRC